ncbi:MAG TPA: hypothetical protein VFB72_17115 [Verrucomicrobiae bacterium]|nr:hypothetical protein [Verrucomicrobiae bacterium]
MAISRVAVMSSLLAVAWGAAWLVPAIAARMERGGLTQQQWLVAAVGPCLILFGLIAISRNRRELRLSTALPPGVRMALLGNGLFVVFCVLEFSDGFLRQNGRVFYWTSILFVPALLLFYGQVLAHRWAWWGARVITVIFSIWFAGVLVMIPFAHLRGNGGPAPWWGKIYAECMTLAFIAGSAGVFRSLGGPEARKFYGIGHIAGAGDAAQSAESNQAEL